MDTRRSPTSLVLTLAITGLALQWIGVADSLVVQATGKDLGVNGTFWFRFFFNLAGLTAVTLAVTFLLPERFRLAGGSVMAIGSLYLLMLPGYYRVFDGPLAEYDVAPLDIIRRPYQVPTEQPRQNGRPGPELAFCGQNLAVWGLPAAKSGKYSLV